MKCIKKGADIQRVSDEQADTMVKDGWKYCPKKEWKVLRDANKKDQKAEPKDPETSSAEGDKKSGKKKGGRGDRNYKSSKYHRRDRDGGSKRYESMTETPPPQRQKSALEILDELEKKDSKA